MDAPPEPSQMPIGDDVSVRCRYQIRGARPLIGDVEVSGAKNAITKQIVASLLTDEPCLFTNVPAISEVHFLLQMLEELGTCYEWIDRSTLKLCTPEVKTPLIGVEYSGVNRIPILLAGPLLHRCKSFCVPVQGGCAIGPRPVNFHVDAMRAMGVRVNLTAEQVEGAAQRVTGGMIEFAWPSVGATESALLMAVLAEGRTTIREAALEPEVFDTILFLQKMGAMISVLPNRVIVIDGVERLSGVDHEPVADRIEAASFACAAIATDGRITVRNARQDHLISFLNVMRQIGGDFISEPDGMTFFRARPLTATSLSTGVFPGFATDWQPPFVVLATQARGESVVHETVYENRFGYTAALNEMGASISLSSQCSDGMACRFESAGHLHTAVIRGATPLHGHDVSIPDLRAGFAYVLSALVAEGESIVSGVPYLERGYSAIDKKLHRVGADIIALND